jgi:hypothetical protein
MLKHVVLTVPVGDKNIQIVKQVCNLTYCTELNTEYE